MRKWLYDRPWIWVVLFLATLIGASVATVIIAEVNKPEIVKPKASRKGASSSSLILAAQARSRDGRPERFDCASTPTAPASSRW